MGQFWLAWGQYLQATALDWNRLNSLPHPGQTYLRAATFKSRLIPAALSSGVSHMGALGDIGVL